MKYSEVIITDENMDEEMEKLADQNGYKYIQFIDFIDKLTIGFTLQESKHGYDEWVIVKALPNHSIDCASPIIESIIAYEFGNGFMVFGDRDSMWD